MSTDKVPSKRFEPSIVRDQVHLALRNLPTMQIGSFIAALVLAYSVRDNSPRTNVIAWILMVLFIVVSRIVFYYRYVKVRDQVFDGAYWKSVYVAMALVSGIIWGLSAFLIFPAGNLGLMSVFILVIASLSAATTVSHSSLRFGPAAWMTPALLLYAARCFTTGGETEFLIGILVTIYYFALLILSFNHHRDIAASINLRFENLKLLDEVRQSEERFRLLFQKHNAVMLLVDPDTGDIVDANSAAERFYGYPPGRLKQMNLQDISQLTPEEIRTSRLRALREECNCFIFPHRLANAEMRAVEVHTSPIKTGDRVLLFSIIHDITERKQAEGRLRESEASYRNLFNSMTDAVFIQDEDGRFLDVNKGAEVMYGRPRDYFLDQTQELLSAPDMNNPGSMAAVVRKAFDGEPQLVDFWGIRADGSVFPQEVRYVPAYYGGRQVVIAVARDISERMRAEAELLKSQKIEAIGVLAGGIAHDFNNLLQGVFGYLAVAKRKIGERDKAVLLIEKAEKALLLSVNLTNQLLTFSKGGKPVKRSINPGSIIDASTRFALSGSTSDCRVAFAEDLWPVEADEGQLGQVIRNIVLNSAQAMPGGGVVAVSARNVDQEAASSPPGPPGPGKWVEITIRDSGIGIPKENFARIFEPYFTTKQTGSGLGLATSYSIIRNHGGMIEVSSMKGKGTTFTVWLPAAVTQEPRFDQRQEPPVHPNGRILIMDDEEVVRDSVGEMLGTLSQDVEFSPDGEAAIERYRAAQAAGAPFSVVILDATVRGGMGGEETIRKLRAIDPAVVAVIASGYSDETVVANYAEYGFKEFLPKPFTLESLQSMLARVMQ